MGRNDETSLFLVLSPPTSEGRKERTLDIFLKDGMKVGSPLDPILLANIANAWRQGHIVVAIQVVQHEHTFFVNIMSVDVVRTLKESGEVVAQGLLP
jgi:hypothetical protein